MSDNAAYVKMFADVGEVPEAAAVARVTGRLPPGAPTFGDIGAAFRGPWLPTVEGVRKEQVKCQRER